MIDLETKSLWSHILGECMEGELKGEHLPPLIADMVTWKAWRARHPQTTVLNLARTAKEFQREFYDRPERFVFGLLVDGQPRHCSFDTLFKTPIVNFASHGEPLVLAFDPESTSLRAYSRLLGDRSLTFTAIAEGRMQDDITGTLWDRTTGTALEGPWKGKQLEARVGIVSFARAWKEFHPESQEVTAAWKSRP